MNSAKTFRRLWDFFEFIIMFFTTSDCLFCYWRTDNGSWSFPTKTPFFYRCEPINWETQKFFTLLIIISIICEHSSSTFHYKYPVLRNFSCNWNVVYGFQIVSSDLPSGMLFTSIAFAKVGASRIVSLRFASWDKKNKLCSSSNVLQQFSS